MPLIILDRDGVINFDSTDYIKSPDEWRVIPGSLEAIAMLNQKGYQIAIATNQAGIAKGLYDEPMLEAIHQKMRAELKNYGGIIDKVFYCPHRSEDHCLCRKPKPGMLKQIAEHFNVNLNNIPFVGDKAADINAARAAMCKPVLVKTGYGEKTIAENNLHDVSVFDSLLAFARSV